MIAYRVFLALLALGISTHGADPPPQPSLLELARVRYQPLSYAEEQLFAATPEGKAASAYRGNDRELDPAKADSWEPSRAVRAECLAWLCTNPNTVGHIPRQGIQLQGIRIDGVLHLEGANLPFPFVARGCNFKGNIHLNRAHLQTLELENTHVQAIYADGARSCLKTLKSHI